MYKTTKIASAVITAIEAEPDKELIGVYDQNGIKKPFMLSLRNDDLLIEEFSLFISKSRWNSKYTTNAAVSQNGSYSRIELLQQIIDHYGLYFLLP